MNFQNIPIRSEEGAKIRSMFIAKPNCKLLILDYAQIETRLFAHFSNDPVLIDIFLNNRDIHSEMAKIAGLDPIKDRHIGKTLVHGITYGSSPWKIAEIAKVSREDADRIYRRFWDELAVGASWITTTKLKAYKYGGVETLMGRWRSFHILKELRCPHQFSYRCDRCRKRGHIEREVISQVVQGSASDIIKKAMLDCDKAGYMPRLSVHDELHFYIPKVDATKETYTTIKHIMENVVQLSVPLIVEGKYCDNWQEAK